MKPLLRRLYAGWMRIARALAWVNTRALLTAVFYAIFTPVGVVRRLLGYDPMRRRFERETASYRVRREPRDATHMERQY
jgi:hypothetical protein